MLNSSALTRSGRRKGMFPNPQSRKSSVLLVLVLGLVLDLLGVREDEDDDDEFRRLDRDQSAFGNTPVRKLQLFRACPAAASAATNSRMMPPVRPKSRT